MAVGPLIAAANQRSAQMGRPSMGAGRVGLSDPQAQQPNKQLAPPPPTRKPANPPTRKPAERGTANAENVRRHQTLADPIYKETPFAVQHDECGRPGK